MTLKGFVGIQMRTVFFRYMYIFIHVQMRNCIEKTSIKQWCTGRIFCYFPIKLGQLCNGK